MLVPCTTFAARRHIMLYYIILYYIKIMVSPCTTSAARGEGGGRETEKETEAERREGEEREKGCAERARLLGDYILLYLYVILYGKRLRGDKGSKGRKTVRSGARASRPLDRFCFDRFFFYRFCFASVLTAPVLTGSPSRIGPAARVRVEPGELFLCNWL